MVSVMLKMMPLWLSKLICHTPLSRWVNKLWHGGKEKSTLEIVQELTENKDLQTVFCYCWGDYGTVPAESHFGMQSVLLQHYQFGAFYPGMSTQPAKLDLNKKSLPRQKTIQNFTIDAQGFRKTKNENPPTWEMGVTS